MEILTRIGLTLLIIVAGITLYLLWTRLQLFRIRRRSKPERNYAGLEELRRGVPAILYFSQPNCQPCLTVQAPAIETLVTEYRERIQVVKVDVTERPDLADYWGVLSVPTTFIIDSNGQPRRINQGVTGADKLRRQLIEFGGLKERAASAAESARGQIKRELAEE